MIPLLSWKFQFFRLASCLFLNHFLPSILSEGLWCSHQNACIKRFFVFIIDKVLVVVTPVVFGETKLSDCPSILPKGHFLKYLWYTCIYDLWPCKICESGAILMCFCKMWCWIFVLVCLLEVTKTQNLMDYCPARIMKFSVHQNN